MTNPRPHKAVRRRRRERGIALISVLWILVVLALLAANMTQTSRASRQLARNLSSTAEARALADGGVYFAIAGLLEPDRQKLLATDGTVYRLKACVSFGGPRRGFRFWGSLRNLVSLEWA